MASTTSNTQALTWNPYASAEFAINALSQHPLAASPSLPPHSLRSIDSTAAAQSRGVSDSISLNNDIGIGARNAQTESSTAILETELVTPQRTPNSSLPQQSQVHTTRTQRLWSRLRSRFIATPNDESLPAKSRSPAHTTAPVATPDESHPPYFSQSDQHIPHPPAHINGDPDLDWNSIRADHTVLYDNPSIAYRAVDGMWDNASVVLHSARLRANTLDRRACNAFRRFFMPFVRFATAYVSLHNGRRRIRTYDLPEASRSKNPAINALACSTQSFNSQLRVLPMNLDATAVVECADEFRTALFTALADADPKHDHRIVEYFSSLHKAPTLLMMLACGVSKKESIQREWVARVLFPESTQFDRALCLPKKARLLMRTQKRVARQFQRAARNCTEEQAQVRRMPSWDRLDQNHYSIRSLRDRPTDWSWHWEL